MLADSSLIDLFFAGLSGSCKRNSEVEDLPLTALFEAVRGRWPALVARLPTFVSALAHEIPMGMAPDAYLRGLDLPDLFLARACAEGDPRALAAFEANYFPDLAHVLSEMNVAPDTIEDIQQMLRERFFVGKHGHPPAIATYSGRGPLRAWTRISALREAYRLADDRKRWEQPGGDDLLKLPALGDDPELRYLKEHARREFKAAFTDAVAALSARQRNLLRHYYMDGLSIDQIGALFRIHRATAARWLIQARQAILSQTRRRLTQRMGAKGKEYESILRIVESQAEISMRVLLELAESSGPKQP